MLYSFLKRYSLWLKTTPPKVISLNILISFFLFSCVVSVYAQQSDIAILLPSTASGISEGDVN